MGIEEMRIAANKRRHDLSGVAQVPRAYLSLGSSKALKMELFHVRRAVPRGLRNRLLIHLSSVPHKVFQSRWTTYVGASIAIASGAF
jgi:hypothetical protein